MTFPTNITFTVIKNALMRYSSTTCIYLDAQRIYNLHRTDTAAKRWRKYKHTQSEKVYPRTMMQDRKRSTPITNWDLAKSIMKVETKWSQNQTLNDNFKCRIGVSVYNWRNDTLSPWYGTIYYFSLVTKLLHYDSEWRYKQLMWTFFWPYKVFFCK